MTQPNCFDSQTLKDYLLGRLPDEQSDVIASHLEACLNCEATISQLDRASDTLTDGLRLPAPAASPPVESESAAELRAALDRVKSFAPIAMNSEPRAAGSATIPLPTLRDYRLLEAIGSGGMGTVYKAVHSRLDRLVAVKLLPARRLGDEQAVARFQREMRVIGQLSHPAIVQATDAGEVDGTHFLVMEFVEGLDLNGIARACGTLSVADACEIARQAALGLEYAHQQGIVHRDIKPSNLMLPFVVPPLGGAIQSVSRIRPPEGGTTSVKILDLGLALLSGEQAPVDELTTVGQLMGTLDYMAPEQLEDSHLVGPRADIYALAATLFRLLTGSAPLATDARKTPLQKLRALATQTAPPIRDRRPDLPADLAAIIDQALQQDPANRFESMSDFAAALTPWCHGHDLTVLAREAEQRRPVDRTPTSGHALSSDVGVRTTDRANSNARVARPELSKGVAMVGANAAKGNLEPDHALRKASGRATQPKSRIGKWLAAVVLIALGAAITLATNNGQLVIETARDVEVRVKQSDRTVKQLQVTSKSDHSTKLAAGEYEIELVGKTDGLMIDKNHFVLKRGDVVVARVSESSNKATAARSAGQESVADDIQAGPVGRSTQNNTVGTESQPTFPRIIRPEDLVDRNAKGMDSFDAVNPEVAAERKIREALRKKITVAFNETPLNDVVQELEKQSGYRVLIDHEALNEEGIALDSLVTCSLKEASISVVLEIILRQWRCAWEIDNGQVVVTTATRGQERLVTRMYPVGRLLPGVRLALERIKAEPLPQLPGHGGGGGGGGFFSVGVVPQLAISQFGQFGGGGAPPPISPSPPIPNETSHFEELLSGLVGGDQWASNGGTGTIELLQNLLVIRQTHKAHADIEALLRTIEGAMLKPNIEPVEIRPAGYDFEADAIVRRKLAGKLDAEFIDMPLRDMTEWLANKLGIQVLIDKAGLEEEGIATDAPVSAKFTQITGESLLSRILKPLHLGYEIEDGLLIITTLPKLSERLITKFYDVRDLLNRGLHPNRLTVAIETTVESTDTWEVNGGSGSCGYFADTLLVVRQLPPTHDAIGKFLTSLRTQMLDQPEVPRAILTKPKTHADTNPFGTRPQSEPATIPTKPNQPTAKKARYEGKTVDEWLELLEFERSPAKLSEAMNALRVLANDASADAILSRAIVVSRRLEPQGGKLQDDIVQTCLTFPLPAVQDACELELRNGNRRSRRFILEALANSLDFQLPGSRDRFACEVLKLCDDSAAELRNESYGWLAVHFPILKTPPTEKPSNVVLEVRKRLLGNLDDKDTSLALAGVRGLLDSDDDHQAVANAIARIVADKNERFVRFENSYTRITAVKYAVVMGPTAAPAAKAIAAILEESPDATRDFSSSSFTVRVSSGPYGIGMGGMMGGGGMPGVASGLDIKQLAAIALARMGKSAAEVLPTIDRVISKQKPVIFLWRFDNGGLVEDLLNSPMTFAEILHFAKLRILNRPIPDVSQAIKEQKPDGDYAEPFVDFKFARDVSQIVRNCLPAEHPLSKEAIAKEEEARRKLRP